MDKVQKIREEVARIQAYTQSDVLKEILDYIDKVQEEPKPKFKIGDCIKPIESSLGSPRTICEVCDSWYVTNQGTLDFEFEDNWELVEEPVSEPQVKESLISIHDDKTCKENGNSLTQEPTIPDIVDEHFYEMLGLEPVSEELEKVVEEIVDPTVLNAYGVKELARRLRNTICGTSVSEDLGEYINKLSKQFQEVSFAKLSRIAVRVAKWQKENLWKPADGDDLPEIDREVVVFTQNFPNDAGIMSVSIAHRPNPDGFDGKSLTTGEVEHYTPKTYGKGGWNIPDIVYWLDIELPKEIEL